MEPLSSAEEVLSYWFGSGSAEELGSRRHGLWFVDGEKRKEERDNVDLDVKERFEGLLRRAVSGELQQEWRASAREVLAVVLVLDQVSRHVMRGNEQFIAECTWKAVQVVKDGIERHLDRHLRSTEFSFFMMPLRHLLQAEKVKQKRPLKERMDLMALLERKLEERVNDDRMHETVFERFQTATDRRNLFRRDEGEEWVFSDADVLQKPEMTVETSNDEDEIIKHKVYQTIAKFLEENHKNEEKLFVSLSGGVDSMVIARCLVSFTRNRQAMVQSHGDQAPADSELAKKRRRMDIQRMSFSVPSGVVAMHIKYGNRPESGAEADFVQRWCAANGIEFKLKEISDLKRGVTPRDDYERQSREIRFQMYREHMVDHPYAGVMFGHHKGDIQENVVSNVMKGCSVMEISGMRAVSRIGGVLAWRPILEIVKEDIYNFASTFLVAWFKDTTPKWSTRGKLRNKLLPTIASVYGSGFGSKLSSLALQSDELHDFFLKAHLEPFWDSISFGPLAAFIPLEGLLDHSLFFWKMALRRVCHRLHASLIRETPLAEFVRRLQQRDFVPKQVSNVLWIVLRHQNPTLILNSGKALVIFREDVLFQRKHYEDLHWGVGDSRLLGNYRVSVLDVSNEEAGVWQEKEEETFDLHAWVTTGKIGYILRGHVQFRLCKNSGKYLQFFHKQDRRLRLSIPIVNVDEDVEATTQDVPEKVMVVIEFWGD